VAAERVTRRSFRAAERATDREVGVAAAVLAAGSERAAGHRLGLSHSTVAQAPHAAQSSPASIIRFNSASPRFQPPS
jgi:hypothetical protein